MKGALAVQHVASIQQAVRRIQKRRAVTAAGNNGALNVWRDDQRVLYSEFMRFRQSLDRAEHVNLDSLRVWLETWWPRLGRDDQAAVSPSEASGTQERKS